MATDRGFGHSVFLGEGAASGAAPRRAPAVLAVLLWLAAGLSVGYWVLQVLGKVKKSKADRQDPQQPHSRHHTPRKKPSQQQHEAQPARIAPLSSISSLVRGGVAAAYRQCTQAEATAADAAAGQGWVPVASLALWQGVGAAEMAQWLLKLTPEQRQQVLAMYASDMQ